MINTYWLNNREANITIKLNDLCNTKCLHCFSHGKDRSFLDIPNNENNFSIFWEELYIKGVRVYDIAFVGGEITLLSITQLDAIFKSFYKSIALFLNNNFAEKEIAENDKVLFNISVISNFIFDVNGEKYFKYLSNLSQNPTLDVDLAPYHHALTLEFNVVTSYDIGLGRFRSQKIKDLWVRNCNKFDHPLHLLITLNKETCLNINTILADNFFDKFSMVSFQPMLNFSDKDGLLPSYKELYDTYRYLHDYKEKYNKPYVIGMTGKSGYHVSINNDGVISCCVSEEVKLYDNKDYFHISNIENSKELFSNMLSEQVKFRIKRTRNKKCLSCEYYEDCNFGFELFTPVVICPAFKIEPK